MKKQFVYILVSATFLFTACQKEEKELSVLPAIYFTEAELALIHENTCLTIIPDDLDDSLEETLPSGS